MSADETVLLTIQEGEPDRVTVVKAQYTQDQQVDNTPVQQVSQEGNHGNEATAGDQILIATEVLNSAVEGVQNVSGSAETGGSGGRNVAQNQTASVGGKKRKQTSDRKRGSKKAKQSNDDDDDVVHFEELNLKDEESDDEYNCCEYKGYVMGVGPREFKKRVTVAVDEWSESVTKSEDSDATQQCQQENCSVMLQDAEVQIHMDSHVKDSDKFTCPDKECTFEHTNWNGMRTHISRHRGKHTFGTWKCNQQRCNQTFTRKLHLKRHVMFKHFYENIARSLAEEYAPSSTFDDEEIKVKVLNTAPQSVKKFKKKGKDKKEKKSQSLMGKKYLRCVKCNAVFKTMPDVDAHMAKHIVRIKCTECDLYFDNEAQLKSHVKEHHSRMLHTNRCQLCSYSCLNSADLKTHMYSHENTVFECDLCGRVCANPKTLKSHRMRKHPDLFQNKSLVCIYCGMVFANDVLLQDHIRNKHKMRLNGQRRVNRREELKFPCNHCGFVANRQSSLQYHMRVHLENRPYKCSHCPYASKTRNNLILHIRTHKALAPLECPHCDFRGATNKVIQQHITSKHTNERPYKCTVCPWSTCYSGNLWKHMRMHKEKDGIDIPESSRKRTPRQRKAAAMQKPTITATVLDKGLPVVYEQIQIQQPPQQQQQQQIHIQQQHDQQQQQQQATHIIHQGHQEVIQMQPRVQVQTQHQPENTMPQFAQVVLASEAPQHHQTVEIQIHGEGGNMVIPRQGDDEMAAETVQQLVNLANMLPVSSSGHVMHTMQPAHAQ